MVALNNGHFFSYPSYSLSILSKSNAIRYQLVLLTLPNHPIKIKQQTHTQLSISHISNSVNLSWMSARAIDVYDVENKFRAHTFLPRIQGF